jgi:branched-chain amino acid transport system permease protein
LTLDLFALQLFTGLALGSIYVLVALGLSLIFGLLTIVNFAHGQFFMLGAYMGAFYLATTGNFWFSLIAVPITVGASAWWSSAISCGRSMAAGSTIRCC